MLRLDLMTASVASALTVASVKAAVLLALASLATLLWRRRSAALKHLIWTVALAATLAVLVLPLVLPAWRVVPLPALSLDARRTTASVARPTRFAVNQDETSGFGLADAPVVTNLAPALLVCLAWLGGAFLVSFRYARSARALRRLTRRARALDAGRDATLDVVAKQLSFDRPVTLLISDEIDVPLTWGVRRPRVLLPADTDEWTASRLAHALQHELAHVKRIDAGTQLVAVAAEILFWFHPLVWHAAAAMRRERERACDDAVLQQGAAASDYAADLLDLVRQYGADDRHVTALAMARRSQFEGRLLALLDPSVERRALSRRQLSIAVPLAMLLVVPIAVLRGADPASFRARHASPAALDGPWLSNSAGLFAGCQGNGGTHSDLDELNGRPLWVASARNGDCHYELIAHGDVTFTDDATAIAAIPAGGDLEITTTVHGEVTHLVASADPTGVVSYQFSRDGSPADFATAGRSWLATFVVELERHTAFAVERRLPALLRQGGATVVLDEVDRIRAEHAKMRYLTGLIASVDLDSASISRVLAAAGTLRSDNMKAQVLLALARSQLLSANLSEYAAVAATLEGAGERRRVLAALSHS